MRRSWRWGGVIALMGVATSCSALGDSSQAPGIASVTPSPSTSPLPIIPTPVPTSPPFGNGVPINLNGVVTNAPPTNGANNSNPAAPVMTPSPSSTPTVSYSQDVVPILRAYCFNCHSTGGSGDNYLALFDQNGMDDYNTISGNISAIVSVASLSSTQPPHDSLSVTSDEISQLDDWEQAGCPDN